MRSGLQALATSLVLLLASGCGESRLAAPLALAPDFPALAFTLIDGDGQTVSATDLAGEVLILSFGFTRCSGTCPMVMWTVKESLDQLSEPQREQVRVVFVSLDYRHDSPRQVGRYAASFGERFLGLAGEPEALQALNRRLGVSARYISTANGVETLQHATGLFLVDAVGQPRYLARSDSSPEQLVVRIRELLDRA